MGIFGFFSQDVMRMETRAGDGSASALTELS